MCSLKKIRVIGLSSLVAVCLAACGREPETLPEAEIRAFVAGAEAAAEERNMSALRALIAKDYADAQGYDRKTIENMMRLHVLRNRSLHVLTRIDSIQFLEPERALVVVMAALAGQSVTRIDELVNLDADLFRFELELARNNGDWQVRHAGWKRAQLADFW